MKFRKLDDHKIHCIISQEEMNEKGMRIEDFLDHRDKTEEFLREILAEAKYELDLDDMGHYYSVQMAVMPEGDVSLVISGEEHDSPEDALSDFSKRLQDFKEIMEHIHAVPVDHGDIAYQVEIFPGYVVQMILWEGDDEFPPSSQILFSDNFPVSFAAEDMAVMGDVIIGSLKAFLKCL